jgi:hypothetical protein
MNILSDESIAQAKRELEACLGDENNNTDDDGEADGRFGRELRKMKNSCPLCSFVLKELEKNNPYPVEEWIYLTHLRNVHGIEP